MCTYLHGPRDGGMYYFRVPTASPADSITETMKVMTEAAPGTCR